MFTHADFEDNMPYYTPFPIVKPARGRESRPVTHHRIGADLDLDQLDADAPLSDDDRDILSNCELQPQRVTDEVKAHVVRRIHAMQRQLWGRSRKWRSDE